VISPDIAQAGETKTYQYPALAPGQYKFFCAVHPNMTGTLNIQ
jgi:plastocyanin